MTPSEASALLDRLNKRFDHHLPPEGRELYLDTLEPVPHPVGRMVVGAMESPLAQWPDLATLTRALEAELTHWPEYLPSAPEPSPASPATARASLADARRALGQS